MKYRTLKILFTLLLLILAFVVRGQDPQFSQFYSNPLYLAPSFAGLTDDSRISLNYRNQWPEIPGGFTTYSCAFDHFFDVFQSGLGVFVMKDVAGSGQLSLTNIGVSYSFDFKISDYWHVRPGLHFAYSQRGIDVEKLVWHDQISPVGNAPVSAEVVPLKRVGNIDVSSSVLAYSDKFWVGFSADHLLTPNQSLYHINLNEPMEGYVPIKYSFFGGTKIIRQGKLYRPMDTSLQLAFLFKTQQKYTQLDLGMYFYKNPVVVGLWYRGIPFKKPHFNQDAFTGLLGLKFNDVSIGYSYDFTISRLITSTGGAHEVSLSYDFQIKIKERRPKMVPCPDF